MARKHERSRRHCRKSWTVYSKRRCFREASPRDTLRWMVHWQGAFLHLLLPAARGSQFDKATQ